jgi:hypothetical protein
VRDQSCRVFNNSPSLTLRGSDEINSPQAGQASRRSPGIHGVGTKSATFRTALIAFVPEFGGLCAISARFVLLPVRGVSDTDATIPNFEGRLIRRNLVLELLPELHKISRHFPVWRSVPGSSR